MKSHTLLAVILSSVGVLLAFASFGAPRQTRSVSGASGARIYVTTTAQKVGGHNTGGCSLQEAIYSSDLHINADGTHGVAIDATDPDDFIVTDCVAGTGNGDVIVLPTGATFSLTNDILWDTYNPYGPTATPIIFSTLTIEGAGATLQWTGASNKNVRLFAIGPASINTPTGTSSGTGAVTIRNVYVKGFHAKGGDGVNAGGGGMGAAGAIYLQNGSLVVENSTFDGNGAIGGNGGGYPNCCTSLGGGGGGIGGNGGGAHYEGSGGGGGGARGNGGNAPGGGGGGGGTVFAGASTNSDGGGSGGYLCGGHGGTQSDDGNDGQNATCAGGGGGGGGYDVNPPAGGFHSINGGSGNYGGGGGGGPDHGGSGGFGGGGGGSTNDHDGGNGGFGGGGSGAGDNPGTGGAFGGNGSAFGGGGGGALGGAIFNDSGSVTLHNCTFINNFVVRGVGGSTVGIDGVTRSAPNGADAGGAIFSYYGQTSIVDCTIANNQSTGSGGGVVVYGTDYPELLTLDNTIIANNGANECYVDGGGPITGAGNLIISNGSGSGQFGACPGVATTTDPQLQSLQPASVNGGLTPTMAIPLFSSAMGTADSASSLAYDERYADRPQPDTSPRNGYDIGAFEVCRRFLGGRLQSAPCSETNSPPPSSTTLTMQVAPSNGGTTNPPPGDNPEGQNSVIPIQATPNPGYIFWNWSGPVSDLTNPSTTVVVGTSQVFVTANFRVVSAVSHKVHGNTGFDIPLPLSGTEAIECRSGGSTGDHQLIVTFATPVTITSNPQAQVTTGTGDIGSGGTSNGGQVSIDPTGKIVTVPLTNITNAQRIVVTLFNVNDSSDGTDLSNVAIPVGVLLGDTNHDGFVNSADIGQTKSQSGAAVNATNFREDLNVDGFINSADIGLVKSKSGTGLP